MSVSPKGPSTMIEKVMLVDDEADIRLLGSMSLSRVGHFQVVLASDGAEAVEVAAREQPDVILLDVMMPALDGPATLARLRARPETASLPVIFLTAKSQEKEVARFLGLGAQGVIAKPFDPIRLPAEVRRILGEG